MVQLADILGPDGAAAQPDQISRVASQLRTIGDTAGSVRDRLSGLDGASWKGQAADEYRTTIDQALPNELSKISQSFGVAADSLGAYVRALDGPDGIMPRAETLVSQANSANEMLASANQSERSAYETLNGARAAHSAASDPVTRVQATHALARAEGSYSNAVADRESAESAVAQITNRMHVLQEELDACAAACVSGLNQASDAGIRDTFGSWCDRRVVNGLPGEVVSVVGQEIGDAAADVGKFVDATGNLLIAEAGLELGAARLWLDPNSRNLAAFGHDADRLAHAYDKWADAAQPILTGIGVGLGVLVLAVACGLAPEGAPAWIGAAMLVEAGVQKGVDIGKLASDAYLDAKHQTSTDTLVNDVFDVGLDIIPDRSGVGEGLDKLSSSLDKYAETETRQAKGWITRRLDALPGAEAKHVIGDVEQKGLQLLERHLAPGAIQWVKSLLGPNPAPDPAPVVGPFTSICQGPSSSIRAQLAPRGVPLEVPA